MQCEEVHHTVRAPGMTHASPCMKKCLIVRMRHVLIGPHLQAACPQEQLPGPTLPEQGCQAADAGVDCGRRVPGKVGAVAQLADEPVQEQAYVLQGRHKRRTRPSTHQSQQQHSPYSSRAPGVPFTDLKGIHA